MREVPVAQELPDVNSRGGSYVTTDKKLLNGRRAETSLAVRMALQDAEAGIGVTDGPGHVNSVSDFSPVSGERAIRSNGSHYGQAEKQMRRRRGGVSADQFDPTRAAGVFQPPIECSNVFGRSSDGYGQ